MPSISLKDEELWAAIYSLYNLLTKQINAEAEYQSLFEKHPVIFAVLGFDTAAPFERQSSHSLPFDNERGFRPEPDFICANSTSGNLAILELKTPFVGELTTARQDGNRAKFRAVAESYISQATEYVDSIQQRADARDVVKTTLQVTRISGYKAILVYGLSSENDAVLINTLASKRGNSTEIIFFDSLLDRMIDAYAIGRRDESSRAGWCFVSHLHIPLEQIHKRAFLAVYGAGHEDHISVYIQNREIVFECMDSTRSTHRLVAPITSSGPHYVRFEFSTDNNGAYLSLNVNNVEYELRLGRSVLRLYPDTALFTLGADSHGENGAHFYMLEHYIVSHTMGIAEKLASFHYFESKVGTKSHCLEFKPSSYMIRGPNGLMQDKAECKPVLRMLPLSEA